MLTTSAILSCIALDSTRYDLLGRGAALMQLAALGSWQDGGHLQRKGRLDINWRSQACMAAMAVFRTEQMIMMSTVVGCIASISLGQVGRIEMCKSKLQHSADSLACMR